MFHNFGFYSTPEEASTDPYWNNVVFYAPLTVTAGFKDIKNDRNLAVTAGTTINGSDAKFGDGSLVLDGSSLVSLTETSDEFTMENQNFTIEVWSKTSANPTGRAALIAIGDRYDEVRLAELTGHWGITGNFSGGGTYISLTTTFPPNFQWNYHAIVKTSTYLRYYLNNSLLINYTTNMHTTNLNSPVSKIHIGQGMWTNDGFYNGRVSHVRVTKGVARDVNPAPTRAFPEG